MTEHIHTYEAPDGSRLMVSSTRMRAWEPGQAGLVVPTPTGDDAVALAQAILAAAGDTGHRVVSDEDVHEGRLAAMRISAEAMRERADDTVAQYWPRPGDERPSALACADVRDAIRSLPLVPDGDDTSVYESPRELADEIARLSPDRGRLDSIDRLGAEVRELHDAQEHQGRTLADLRADMNQATAAIRGVGQELREHAEAHLAYAADLEARLQRLEDPGTAGADG